MTAAPPATIGVLTYASPDVRTSPRRTILRSGFAALRWTCGVLLTGVRLCVMASGYLVWGAGIALRFAFSLVAMILLFVGGIRWDVVKRRTLGGANRVDAKVLSTIAFFRRQVDRLPPHHSRGDGDGGGDRGAVAR